MSLSDVRINQTKNITCAFYLGRQNGMVLKNLTSHDLVRNLMHFKKDEQ